MVSSLKYIIVAFLGWFFAQAIKVVVDSIKNKKFKPVEYLFISGGMPSSHSSLMVAVTTLIGFSEGITSALFGLALAMSLIVIYDALNVRKSVGDQAIVIGKIISENKLKIRQPKIVNGHKITEAIVGAFLGFIVGAGVFLLTK